MPRWNTCGWSLGTPALVALAVAGCGASGNPRTTRQGLRSSSEKRLLALVARARVDASHHDGTGVHAVLGEFVSEVQRLRTSGQLATSSATTLDREARATAARAARQLHPPAATTGGAGTATSTAPADSATAPGASPPHKTTSLPTQPLPPSVHPQPPRPRSGPIQDVHHHDCAGPTGPLKGKEHPHPHGRKGDWFGCASASDGRAGDSGSAGGAGATQRWSQWSGAGGD